MNVAADTFNPLSPVCACVCAVCELYTEVEADSSVRLYWAEEGQRLYPHRESVVKLREALLSRDGTQSREDLEKLYLGEFAERKKKRLV